MGSSGKLCDHQGQKQETKVGHLAKAPTHYSTTGPKLVPSYEAVMGEQAICLLSWVSNSGELMEHSGL